MMKQTSDLLTTIRGAEYVIRGEGTLTLLSGGRIAEIGRSLSDKDKSRLFLRLPVEGHETTILTGSADQVLDAYRHLERTATRRHSIPASIKTLTVTVAVIAALGIAAFQPENTRVPQPSATRSSEYLGEPLSPDIAPETLSVMPRPSFLDDTPAPGAGLSAETPAAPSSPPGEPTPPEPSLEFPAYDPGLYTGQAPDNPTPSASGEDLLGTAPSDPPEAMEKKLRDFLRGDNASTADAPSTADALSRVQAPGDDAPTAPPPAPEPPEASEQPPVSEPAPVAADQAPPADGVIEDEAAAAVRRAIGGGMTQDDVRELLMNLQQMNVAGEDALTPEMLQSLPEEIAAMFLDGGMEPDGQGGGQMNILPSEVVDSFRGKDGIATIPENYSWYARSGGPVSIPLPGGGDIKSPEDLLDFGLQP